MKKMIALCMILMLAVGSVGCGSKGDREEKKSSKFENILEESENVSEKETKKDKEDTENEKTFVLGTIDEDVYENEFTGMGYELNGGWTFYSESQIRELNNATFDMMDDEYREMVENATLIYEMYAIDSEALNNFNVNLEKSSLIKSKNFDIKDNFEKAFPILVDSYENMGYTNVSHEIGSVEIAGRTLDCMYISAEISGVPMYQTMFSYKCEDYLVSACITTYFEDTCAEVYENIYWLD